MRQSAISSGVIPRLFDDEQSILPHCSREH
jgi:hypothetical protein